MKRAWILIAALMAAPAMVHAVPNTVHFQATVTTGSQGDLLPAGVYAIALNFYDSASTGTLLWGPYLFDGGSGDGHAPQVAVLAPGRISVAVGPKDTSSKNIMNAFSGSACFAEITIDSVTISPRRQFLTSPFAFSMPNVLAKGSYVGVGGVTTPIATLDVNGTIRASSDITVGTLVANSLIISGSISGLGTAPIGSIVAWHKSLSGVGTLPANWVECNGGIVNDAQSPINSQAIPNLNNAAAAGVLGRYLRGDTSSGNAQTPSVKGHQHTIPSDDYYGQNVTQWGKGSLHYDWMGWAVDQTKTTYATGDANESKPYSYTVVWIMRIK
ncbi:MAG: hypothetical protein NTX50_01785 [Candidatus Sumerlaeota bacterium]|nr:hypothetical protein [Candidatus Sumerlaeota bacterium]